MELLLRKDIAKLGLAGDVVNVAAGYGRNYLLPHHLAVLPTDANRKQLEADKRLAAEIRAQRHAELKATAKRLAEVEVTISAAANPEGRLYGSVGAKEISQALKAEGHAIEPEHVRLPEPLRTLDAIMVPLVLADKLEVEVKVWVVRDTPLDEDEEVDSEEPTESEGTDAHEAPRGSVDAIADD